MLAFRQTCCRTGGSHGRVDHFRVAEGGNGLLCDQNFAADGAVLAFRQAAFRTGGSHGRVDHFSVTEGSNFSLRNQNFAANGAVLAFRQTCCRTGGSHRLVDHFGVRCHGDHFLRDSHCAADGAVLAFRQTCCRTGGSHRLVDHFGVGRRLHRRTAGYASPVFFAEMNVLAGGVGLAFPSAIRISILMAIGRPLSIIICCQSRHGIGTICIFQPCGLNGDLWVCTVRRLSCLNYLIGYRIVCTFYLDFAAIITADIGSTCCGIGIT